MQMGKCGVSLEEAQGVSTVFSVYVGSWIWSQLGSRFSVTVFSLFLFVPFLAERPDLNAGVTKRKKVTLIEDR